MEPLNTNYELIQSRNYCRKVSNDTVNNAISQKG